MSLEERHGLGKRFWYRVKRVDGRIGKEYIGSIANPIIDFAYRHERLARAERAAAKQHRASELRNWKAAEGKIKQYHEQLGTVLAAWLELNGFQMIKGVITPIRNRTRRKRKIMTNMTRDEFESLLAKAESGDQNAQQQLRLQMFNDPETWLVFGDMTAHVEQNYVSLLTRGNWVAQESLRMSIAELKRILKIGNDGAVCKLAVDEVVISFLHLRYQQLLAATPQATEAERDRIERRLNVARNRYKDSLELLAQIKRMTTMELEILTEHKIRSEVA